jgi:phosphatidylserine/phosphatidylglycerophosphate/cardiolipin synthase-like enzyme
MTDVLDGLDARIGDLIEGAGHRHHRRRLARIGWQRALRGDGGGWASGQPPPRDGNRIEVDIDGASALPAIVSAVRGARSFVHVAGWTINPDFAIERDPMAVTVRDLLAETAGRVDVRVLVWAGAPVPLIHPTRVEAKRSLEALLHGTRIRGALDKRNRPMHCHHEKLVIIDGTVAFVGGIDLTDLGGDRFDKSPHSEHSALGWHDVLARLTGPTVTDVASHFAMRWEATTGERLAPVDTPAPAGASRVQMIRTVPERTYAALPGGDFGVLESYVGALRGARRLIYLENQFLWSTEIVAILSEKLLRPPTDDFRICIVLPKRPNTGNDDTRGQLGVLKAADRHGRLLAGTIGPPTRTHSSVYVHAKVGIIDDAWLTVGSANLNEHSLFNDTEVNVVTDDAVLARSVRERLWSEHLAEDCTGRDALDLIETTWRRALTTPAGSGPPLRALPFSSRRSARLLGPLKGLLVDG